MTAKRVCAEPGCPAITDSGRCPTHRRDTDRARGTRQQRGYDRTHDQARARAIRTATPDQPCARCGLRLGDYRAAHLDHTDDRTGYLGLSHADCNVRAARRGGG